MLKVHPVSYVHKYGRLFSRGSEHLFKYNKAQLAPCVPSKYSQATHTKNIVKCVPSSKFCYGHQILHTISGSYVTFRNNGEYIIKMLFINIACSVIMNINQAFVTLRFLNFEGKIVGGLIYNLQLMEYIFMWAYCILYSQVFILLSLNVFSYFLLFSLVLLLSISSSLSSLSFYLYSFSFYLHTSSIFLFFLSNLLDKMMNTKGIAELIENFYSSSTTSISKISNKTIKCRKSLKG